jgi:bacillithiol biosynthesis deacetylase BshB1
VTLFAPCELLAIAAHPDDAELGCGGTLAAFARAGSAAILDLTQGERASRGTPELRWEEALEAARALGVARGCLGLPDTALAGTDPAQREALVAALRQLRPQFLLLPHPEDPHPDHRQAHQLARAAVFLAGVAGYGTGGAWRPRVVLAYPGPRQLFEPQVVVDVSPVYNRKRSALACFRSQFAPGKGEPTHLASGFFLQAVEGRDRAWGNTVGVAFGEGFSLVGPQSATALGAFFGRLG